MVQVTAPRATGLKKLIHENTPQPCKKLVAVCETLCTRLCDFRYSYTININNSRQSLPISVSPCHPCCHPAVTGTVSAISSHVRVVLCLMSASDIGTAQLLGIRLLALRSLHSKQRQTGWQGSEETRPFLRVIVEHQEQHLTSHGHPTLGVRLPPSCTSKLVFPPLLCCLAVRLVFQRWP